MNALAKILKFKPKVGDDEQKLIEQILDGDVDRFKFIVRKYKEYLCKTAIKYVSANQVEEVVQEAFVRSYKSLSGYNGGSFKSWLTTILIRTTHDFWKKEYKRDEVPIDSSPNQELSEWLDKIILKKSEDVFNEETKTKEAREILDISMRELSPDDRMLLNLIYFEGYSIKEVAQQLNYSESKVKVQSHRARKKLRDFLKEKLL